MGHALSAPGLSEVKKLAQKAFLFLSAGIVAAIGATVGIVVVIVIIPAAVIALRGWHGRQSAG